MTSWVKKVFKKSDADQVEQGDFEETDVVETEEDEGQLAVDVFQDKDNLVIKSTIAGVKPEDLDISLSSDSVTISGERREEREVDNSDYFFQECYWGSFSRSLALPVEVDVDSANAEIKDGILTLTLPKSSKNRTKKVKVKGET